MGFDDLFADISFPDTQISLTGDAVPAGQQAASPPVAGQDGVTPPSIEGAPPGDSPTPAKGVVAKPLEDGTTKPPPYDQDPKWKAARAAEKAVQDILSEHSLLDIEELKDALKSGLSLKQVLGSRDASKLIQDAEEYAKVTAKTELERRSQQLGNETPDETIARLTQERDSAISDRDTVKSDVEARQHSEKVVKDYVEDVDRVIGLMETPIPDTEKSLLRLVLGVDNPSNIIDIEDRKAVREMAQTGVKTFQSTIQAIKQQAIDDYAAGKGKLVVSSRSQEGAPPSKSAERKSTPSTASTDEVFDAGKNELFELIMKGIQAAA